MHPNLKGSLAMVFAMGAFAIEDMCLKAAAATLPVGQILITYGFGGMLIFMLFAVRHSEPVVHPALFTKPLLIRSLSEIAGRIFFSVAIAITPLSSATAILQATPLVVALGAVLLYGEHVDWRRWLAILAGFIGVLLILRPGPDGFSYASILAVVGMLGYAGRDLATRASPLTMSNRQLGIYGFLMLTLSGAVLLIWTGGAAMPGPAAWALLVTAMVVGVAAYYALTISMRTGEMSVVASFRYVRLVFAMLIGVLIFHERPDAMTLLGSAIIIASGLYTALRSRKLKSQPA